MARPKQGFYWHVHHNALLEWCYDYKKRTKYIRQDKPLIEQELRLRLFQPVKEQLPDTLFEALAACREAKAAYDKAKTAHDKTKAAFNKAEAALHKIEATYNEAWDVYYKAARSLDQAEGVHWQAWGVWRQALSSETIQTLHALECPGCPWDGRTIFSKKEEG